MTTERRADRGTPPTIIMQSYQAMEPEDKRRLQKLGLGLTVFGVGMPMAIEPFVVLSWVYWTFSGLVAVAGICLLWPAGGFFLLDRIARTLARFIPSKKVEEVLRPERREGE